MTCPRATCSAPSALPDGVAAAPVALAHRDVRRVIFGIMLAMFLGALEQTIVATALPTMGEAFGDFVNLSWVVTAYLLACTVATPLYGKLSDIHGRRVMLLVSVAVFTLASVACALAPNLPVLALARGLQGLGGGGLISLSQTIIADVVSPRERGRYQAQIATVFAVASVAGPVLGGALAQHLHWSLIFWINVPLGIAAYAVTDRALRRLPRHERRHRMDYPGALLMVSANVCLLLALSWGGVRHPWGSVEILGLLAAAAALGAGFVWRMRVAAEPFLPLDLLCDPVVSRAIPAAFAAAGIMVGLSIFVPLYLELVRGLSASQSGLGLIPLVGGVVCGATASGRAMLRLAHYRLPALAGGVLAAAALAGLALGAGGLRLDMVSALLALTGIGIGMILPVCTVSIQNAVEPHRMGTVTGIMTFFRQLGGATAVAVLGAILLAIAGLGGSGGIEMLGRGPGGPSLDAAFQVVFGAAALVVLASLAFMATMVERPLRGAVRVAADEGGLGAE
ncbi:MDR family MFS transporter [Xanthobacter sp. V4C-4]|uniref:MDR family MFS transporter n=1 Tax=Xanthobacter cornucopiae TaxID=3119924 RepID=UPI00372AB1C7